MKTFDTLIYNNVNLIGFDNEVYLVQQQLSRIPWLQATFGIARRQKRDNGDWYPQGTKNQIGITSAQVIDQDLTFDDSYASRIFFFKEDSDMNAAINKWNWVDLEVDIAQKFCVILHCNLQALEITSSEQIKADILHALQGCPHLIGLSFGEDIDTVWKGFTLTEMIKGVTRYPNFCFRIEMICNYPQFPTNGAAGYQPTF